MVRGTSDATSYVGRLGNVGYMPATELVTHRHVTPLLDPIRVRKLPVDRHAVLLEEIVGIHVLHHVTGLLLAPMRDVNSLSSSLVHVAESQHQFLAMQEEAVLVLILILCMLQLSKNYLLLFNRLRQPAKRFL